MERRQRQRRVVDVRQTPAEHEADVRAAMERQIEPWLRRKGLEPERKRCTRCRQWVLVTAFYKRARSLDGRMSHCKACRLVADQARRARQRLQQAPRSQ